MVFCRMLLPGFIQNSMWHHLYFEVRVVHPYSSTNMVTTWKKSTFVLLERSDFHMVVNLSIAYCAMCILIWLSVNKILLPKHMNWSVNFGGLSFNEEIAPSWLRLMNLGFIWVHIISKIFYTRYSKSLQVSRTLLNILADFNSTVVFDDLNSFISNCLILFEMYRVFQKNWYYFII